MGNTILSLFLDHNPIGDDGAIYLANLLQMHDNTIQELTLQDTEIWEDGCIMFSKAIATMSSIKKLSLDDNSFEYYACDDLLRSMKRNTVLVRLFNSNPALFNDNSIVTYNKDKWNMIDFYLRLNQANRRALNELKLHPSLWTNVIQKANTQPDTLHYILCNAPQLFQ